MGLQLPQGPAQAESQCESRRNMSVECKTGVNCWKLSLPVFVLVAQTSETNAIEYRTPVPTGDPAQAGEQFAGQQNIASVLPTVGPAKVFDVNVGKLLKQYLRHRCVAGRLANCRGVP
jgi:hypothetical protein